MSKENISPIDRAELLAVATMKNVEKHLKKAGFRIVEKHILDSNLSGTMQITKQEAVVDLCIEIFDDNDKELMFNLAEREYPLDINEPFKLTDDFYIIGLAQPKKYQFYILSNKDMTNILLESLSDEVVEGEVPLGIFTIAEYHNKWGKLLGYE